MHNMRWICCAERIDQVAEKKGHERLSQPIADGRGRADYDGGYVEAICKTEKFVERHFLLYFLHVSFFNQLTTLYHSFIFPTIYIYILLGGSNWINNCQT